MYRVYAGMLLRVCEIAARATPTEQCVAYDEHDELNQCSWCACMLLLVSAILDACVCACVCVYTEACACTLRPVGLRRLASDSISATLIA